MAPEEIDSIDLRILDALQNEGRMSWRDLGDAVGLSAPAVRDRARSLEARGVIVGYRAVIDPELLGLGIRAIIRVNNVARSVGQGDAIDEIAKRRPEIIECHRVTGSEGYVMRAVLRSTAHLEELLEEFWEYSDTVTNIVTSTPVARRPARLYELLANP